MTPQYIKGERIEVIRMADPDGLPTGATGTVKAWHPALFTIEVAWDAPHEDRHLNVTTDEDEIRKI